VTRRARLVLFAIGGLGLFAVVIIAVAGIPGFGGGLHPYRDRAVAAALAQVTPNAVASVNFDLRGLDTLGEELILLASVLGATTLLRTTKKERKRRPPAPRQLPSTVLAGYLMLPVTLVLGLDVVVHGHLTPGGGFQGGIVLATGLHLLYVAGSYPALRRLRPLDWYEYGEAAGSGVFALTGLAGVVAGTGLLANLVPHGSFGSLISTGTVPLLNVAVGIGVGAGAVVLLAAFLEAEVATR
jgi:multicomponent Na+:H+ antiporter subunit B